MGNIFNRRVWKEKRQRLRNRATREERILWQYLRGRGVGDAKFRRQASIGPYIVDFYCPAHRLAIELDGGQHGQESAKAYDGIRTDYLSSLGIRVLRFPNAMIRDRLEEVRVTIAASIAPQSAP